MIGETLLHYMVLERLGEGGMGVVYKGRDTELDRLVALKVLPRERVASEDARRRFMQEARAASALNHPNIVTIHHVGSHADQIFIAMELVAGRSLAEIIPRQGLPIGRALKLAVQIADGLATAHRAGLVHRDVKPANIMVTDEGRVKILDFGLAKLEPPAAATDITRAQSDRTDAGLIVGTVGYMSPEQAEGAPLDSRSDIFSFGVVLYEMVTGRRPFGGETPMKTLSSILRDAPPPVSEVAPGCPRELERVIDRCLRKDPARRWQHMDDVRITLLELQEESESGSLQAATPAAAVASRRRWWPAAAGAAALVLAALAWYQARPPGQPTQLALVPVPLTTFPGDERDPTFSPDGTQVAFSWGPENGVTNMYVKLIGPGEPIRVTNSPQTERMAQWSPDGRWIVFGRRVAPATRFIVMPALGGPEREVARAATLWAFWTPDSQAVLIADGSPAALYKWPLDGGAKSEVVGPVDGRYGITAGNFSPDGKAAALLVDRNGRFPLYAVETGADHRATGVPRPLTPLDWDVSSMAWSPDGRDVIFIRTITGDNLGGITAMYRVSAAGGTPTRLDFAGDNPWFLDVSRRGNRLAYTRLQRDLNVYAAELAADGTMTSAGRLVASSSRRDIAAVMSPDGARIALASDRDGSSEIWITGADGRNPVQLTQLARSGIFDGADWPRWSPDGSQIAFVSREPDSGSHDIYVMGASGGTPKRLTDDAAWDIAPTWSADGQTIYFLSDRDDALRVWAMPASGGAARRLSATPSIGVAPLESADRRWVYFRAGSTLNRVSTAGGNENEVLKERVSYFQLTPRGIFFLSRAADLLSAELRLAPLDGGASKLLGKIPHYVLRGVSFSPDLTRMLYTRCDQCAADLMLVENFR